MNYIEYSFTYKCEYPVFEVLPTMLADLGFESFQETEDILLAYIPENQWHKDILNALGMVYDSSYNIKYSYKKIAHENWNETWEQNFSPVVVDGILTLKASFHKNLAKTPYEITINPKMSFGTGHHETTHMMCQILLNLDVLEKKILDMGCGTAVLAILADIRGAKSVDAVDIDPWCVDNSKENIALNNAKNTKVYEGDVSFLSNQTYDVVLANINRNILLADMPSYAKALATNGVLALSGFHDEDLPLIARAAEELGLSVISHIKKNNWVAVKITSV